MFHSPSPSWFTQRVTSFALALLAVLCYFALLHDSPLRRHGDGLDSNPAERLTPAMLIFVCYDLFVHLLASFFPLRLCWSTWTLTQRLKAAAARSRDSFKSASKGGSIVRYKTFSSEFGYESGVSSDSDDSELTYSIETGKLYSKLVLHAILIPNYKEGLDTLRETLEVLAHHSRARTSYDIYLAMELGEVDSAAKGALLMKEFADAFRAIDCTLHPRGIPGEAQGKSSNLRWAAKYASTRYPEEMKQNVIVTVVDADSHLSSNYFTLLSSMHLDHPTTASKTIYAPPIIFDRNAHVVPTVVRVADIFWCGAGLSCHYVSSSVCPPTSVYSLPMSLVDHVGGWDAGDEAIGEDMHMYLKCFFALNGNLKTRTILSPASQTNVHSDGKGVGGFVRDVNARYRQALRHMWGSLDSGYAAHGILKMVADTWRNNVEERPHWSNTLVLLYRLYEAHFLPVHIAILLLTSSIYTVLVPPPIIHPVLFYTLSLTNTIRLCTLLVLTVFIAIYGRYHSFCVSARYREMNHAGLADAMNGFSYRKFWGWRGNWSDYTVFPIAGTLFGSVPALVALCCHFYTLRLVYKVSKKPTRNGAAGARPGVEETA
ncbi:glycosyl transferase family group 2-domain-containing protein [Xylogone sp. PMI_703]|nr:glycosyl transferase family group 2-domain-containing protein [Xylogone sp. PMI_703]